MANRTFHCYAEGRDGVWEAICLDLDIVVQGRSFDDASTSLREAITLYLETVADLRPDEQGSLLRRRAPLSVRFQYLAHAVVGLFCGHHRRSQRRRFTMPLGV